MTINKSSAVTLAAQDFFAEQIALLQAGRADELIERHYHPDACLISFDRIVKGERALKEHFREYLKRLGTLNLKSTDKFMATDDSIFFEATVQTDLGEARVYDAFVLHQGKISYHFTGTK